MHRILEELGLHVSLAKTTEAALDELRSSAFDAVISDMRRGREHEAGTTLVREMRDRGNPRPRSS